MKTQKNNSGLMVHFAITLTVGLGLLLWGFVDKSAESLTQKYLWVWLFGEILFIFPYLKLPVAIVPLANKSILLTVSAAVVASSLVIALASLTNTLSFIQLFSFVPSATLGAWLALFVFGFVIVIPEENLMAPLPPTLMSWFRNTRPAIAVSLFLVAVLFGAMHMVLEGIILSLFVSAFFFRVVASIGNMFFGRLFGDVCHSVFNSFVIGVVVFHWPLFSLWFFPVALTVLPYVFSSRK